MKIEACTNKYSFVWKKATTKNEARLQGKVRKLPASLGYNQGVEKMITADSMRNVLDDLRRKAAENTTFMHMKEDHMRNSQLKPGYNVQIGELRNTSSG